MTLKLPSPDFDLVDLPLKLIQPGELLRLSKHDTNEPYFGKSGLNRFDDPRRSLAEAERFGTCYFGLSLQCAFAETVLHDRIAMRGSFRLPVSELEKWVLRFGGTALSLADLTGASLKRLGADGTLSTIMPYELP